MINTSIVDHSKNLKIPWYFFFIRNEKKAKNISLATLFTNGHAITQKTKETKKPMV